MKRFITLLLVIFLSTSLVSCNNNEKNDNNSTESSYIQMEDSSKENIANNSQGERDFPGTLRVNLSTVKYCIDAPGDFSQRANTGHIVKMGSFFIIYDHYVESSEMQFGVKLDSIKSANDVMEAMKLQMAKTSSNGLIFADEYTVVVNSSENVKVNTWDMCKTKGTINLSSQYKLDYESVDFVAYSVIKDGFPVYFAVIENPAEMNPINIESMADKIAKTFREYSEDK